MIVLKVLLLFDWFYGGNLYFCFVCWLFVWLFVYFWVIFVWWVCFVGGYICEKLCVVLLLVFKLVRKSLKLSCMLVSLFGGWFLGFMKFIGVVVVLELSEVFKGGGVMKWVVFCFWFCIYYGLGLMLLVLLLFILSGLVGGCVMFILVLLLLFVVFFGDWVLFWFDLVVCRFRFCDSFCWKIRSRLWVNSYLVFRVCRVFMSWLNSCWEEVVMMGFGDWRWV